MNGSKSVHEINVAGGTVRCCRGCGIRRGWGVRGWMTDGLRLARVGSYLGFLTITEGSEPRSAEEHFASVSRFLEDLWKLLGGKRTYVGMRELQTKRGETYGVPVWHTHLAVFEWKKISFEDVRALLVRHGLGSRFNVRVRKIGSPQDVDSAARYMSKTLVGYMTKTYDRDSLYRAAMDALPKGSRLHLSSRDFCGGVGLAAWEREHKSMRQRMRVLGSTHALPDLAGSPEDVQEAALVAAALGLGATFLCFDADPDPPAEVPATSVPRSALW